MPDPTDVLLFAQGVALPAEVDFTLEPRGDVGDRGIETGLIAFDVPEPASLALLGIALGSFWVTCRRPPRKDQQSA
jgi:PEP-CTERM motif